MKNDDGPIFVLSRSHLSAVQEMYFDAFCNRTSHIRKLRMISFVHLIIKLVVDSNVCLANIFSVCSTATHLNHVERNRDGRRMESEKCKQMNPIVNRISLLQGCIIFGEKCKEDKR